MHSLTVTLTYELVSPYPKFDPSTSLYLSEEQIPTVLLNTGNLFHQIQFNPTHLKQKPNKSNILKTDVNQPNPDLQYHYKSLIPNDNDDIKERRFFKRTKQTPSNHVVVDRKKQKPDIYDIFNEEDCKIDKNYRIFRNKMLADKKYEFVDEYVRKPLHSSNKKMANNNSKKLNQSGTKTVYLKKCTALVLRSYVLLNEESVSTCTSIEDLDSNFQEYPVALPINVYTDQTQLSMIPNYKALELSNSKKVVITQTSLDIEILSNEIANIICNKEGFRFAFLIDFDAVVLQVKIKQRDQ